MNSELYESKKMYCDSKFTLIKEEILKKYPEGKATASRVYIDFKGYRIVLNKLLRLDVIYKECSEEIKMKIIEIKNIIVEHIEDFEFVKQKI